MPIVPSRPQELIGRPFRGSDAVRQGLLTETQLRSKAWTRIVHDVYIDSRVESDHTAKCHGAFLRLPDAAVVAGPSAAFLYGVTHAATFTDDVHVIVPPAIRGGRCKGVAFHTVQLDRSDVRLVAGVARTSPVRTAWDVAVWSTVDWSVGVIDSLLAQGLVGADELAQFAQSQRTNARPGSRRAAIAFSLADGRAQSSMESRLRVRLILAGLPRPVPQHPITLPSGRALHPDLAWPEYRVAAEYDGRWHDSPEQFISDRKRINILAKEGWIVLHVTGDQFFNDFDRVADDVRNALISRGWRPSAGPASRDR